MTISEKNNQLANWVNENRDLLNNYVDQWIAYNLKGIIVSGKDLHEVCDQADKSGKKYILYFNNRRMGVLKFL